MTRVSIQPGSIQPGKKKYKKSAVTQAKLVDASMKLMSERGYHAATIRDICKRAEVSPGTFYTYFESKLDILRDMFERADRYFQNTLPDEIEGKAVLEKLRIFTRLYCKLNLDTGLDAVRVLFSPENSWFTLRRPMQEMLVAIVTEGQQTGVLKSDIAPHELADVIFVVLRGVCYSWCTSNGEFDIEERTLNYLEICLKGVQA